MNYATCFWLKYNDDTKLVTGNVTSTKIYDEAKEKLFPVETLPDELFFEGSSRYKIVSGKLVLRSEADILKGVSVERKEELRKEYCKKEIRKLYDIDKEFQLQRKGLLNKDDTEFVDYINQIEAIITNSKSLTIAELKL